MHVETVNRLSVPILHLELHPPDCLLVGHLVPPEPVLVVAGEAVDNDGDGQGEDEHAAEGAQPAQELADKRLGKPETGFLKTSWVGPNALLKSELGAT